MLQGEGEELGRARRFELGIQLCWLAPLGKGQGPFANPTTEAASAAVLRLRVAASVCNGLRGP